jgi:hypothetical protein
MVGLVSVKIVSPSDQNKAQGYKGVFVFGKDRTSQTCFWWPFFASGSKKACRNATTVQKLPKNRHQV